VHKLVMLLLVLAGALHGAVGGGARAVSLSARLRARAVNSCPRPLCTPYGTESRR
jgi:hypothetical protein